MKNLPLRLDTRPKPKTNLAEAFGEASAGIKLEMYSVFGTDTVQKIDM